MTNLTRVRVKKGVRPYGGRAFNVLKQGVSSGGREWVELDVTSPRTKFGLLGATSSPRRYGLEEVEPLEQD